MNRKMTLALAGLAMAALAGCSSAGPPPAPETAAQVASGLHLSGFADCGSGPYTADSGVARDDGVKIGIDTFGSAAQLDSWEKLSGPLGVTPWHQGSTWVAYRAEVQTGECT